MKKKFILLTFIIIICLLEISSYGLLKTNLVSGGRNLPALNSECINVLEESYINPWFGPVGKQGSSCDTKYNNTYGFKSTEYPKKKEPDQISLLILGGSVAEMFYFKESEIKENRIIPLLEKEINSIYSEKTKKIIKVYNAARRDYRSPQNLHFLINEIHKFDIIISIEGYNEMWAIKEGKVIPSPSNEYKAVLLKEELRTLVYFKRLIDSTILKSSFFFSLLQQYINAKIVNKIDSPYGYEKIESGDYESALEKYLSFARSFGGICEAHQKSCYLMFQPHPMINKTLSKDELAISNIENKNLIPPSLYNKTVEVQMSEPVKGLKKVSLLGVFKKISETIYTDHIHLNERGNKILRNRIIEILNNDRDFKSSFGGI